MKGHAGQNLKGVRLLKADAHSNSPGTVTGVAIDCQGFGELLAVQTVDDVNTTGDIVTKFQESATGVTSPDSFTDITGGTFTEQTAVGLTVGRINLEKRMRYIRAVADIDDAAVDAAVLGVLVPNKNLPVEQVAALNFDV